MKRKIIACIVILFLFCLTSCGGGSSSDSKNNINNSGGSNESSNSKDSISKSEIENEKNTSNSNSENATLSEEMLVYSCNMEIDVMEFQKAVSDFKSTLKEYDGFVESENYMDNGSRSHYLNNDKTLMHTYSATVRVPSSKYENFVSGLDAIGTLRFKNAKAENISQEYSDAKTTLEIYEAKRDRYIKMLSTITDDEHAINVEKELTNIEIEIKKLKTNMNKMNNDVAYSYVHIELNEVTEYTTPYSEKTFLQKLQETVKRSWEYFLYICQTILFIFIFFLPYIAIIAIIVLIIFKITKNKKKKNPNNYTKRPQGHPNPNMGNNINNNINNHLNNNMNNNIHNHNNNINSTAPEHSNQQNQNNNQPN